MPESSLSIGRQRVGAFKKRSRVAKMPLDIRTQWNAGTACVSECVLKTLACRGLCVGPSKENTENANSGNGRLPAFSGVVLRLQIILALL